MSDELCSAGYARKCVAECRADTSTAVPNRLAAAASIEPRSAPGPSPRAPADGGTDR